MENKRGEDTTKFINSVFILSKLITKMEDKFFALKFYNKTSDFISNFIEYKRGEYKNSASHKYRFRNVNNIAKSDDIVQHFSNVAQYRQLDLLNSIDRLLDFIENLSYLKKTDTTPLLSAQLSLLKFKLHILKQIKTKDSSDRVLADNSASNSEQKPPAKIKSYQPIFKPDSNKGRIFNFIKKFPQVRTREIVDEFSALSDRTVKRNLKELIDAGLLKRKTDGTATYYLTS